MCKSCEEDLKDVKGFNRIVKSIGDRPYRDLTGQQFGRLTAIKAVGRNRDGRILWLCLCKCGKRIITSYKFLLGGDTKSCGCLKKETPLNFRDLTGKKFYYLTAIRRVDDLVQVKGRRRVRWLCRCDCGKEVLVLAESLTTLNTKSCGCISSSGENLVERLLKENGISFEKQKTFEDLRTDKNYLLRFDFYVPVGNYLIEYDGEQHFNSRDNGWMTKEVVEENKRRDRMKNVYCTTHDITLIRIPYTHYKNLCVDDLRPETSNFIVKSR